MRPCDPNTLVKQVHDEIYSNEVDLDDDESSDDDSDEDSDSDGNEPIVFHTRSHRKTPELPNDNNVKNDVNRVEVTIGEPEAQEIDRQSDTDSYNQLTVVQMVRMGVLVPNLLHRPSEGQQEKGKCLLNKMDLLSVL